MHKSALLFYVVLVTFGLLTISAAAANVNGTKFFDYDQNGILDGDDFPLDNWNITLYWPNGTAVPGMEDVTGPNGYYNISGIDPDFDYTVCEELKPGWINTTPLCYPIGFVLCTDDDLEFLTNESNMDLHMDNVPDMSSRALLLYNARIGNAVTGTGNEEEIKIAYPLGQWNPGQSSSGLSPGGEFTWTNNTYVPFNATWVPGATLYQDAFWDVGGTTVAQNETHDRPDAVPIRDIVLRLHSEDPDYIVQVNNLSIHQGPYAYDLVNSNLIFKEIAANDQDLYFVFRASDALIAQGGQGIGTGGFSFTGELRFIWPGADSPKQNDMKLDVIVGRYDCAVLDTQSRDFGNYKEFCIQGYKIDNQTGEGLQGWNITVNDDLAQEVGNDTTDQEGYYQVCGLVPGNYTVCEELQDGWANITPVCQDIIVAITNVSGINFTNTQNLGTIDGIKFNDLNGDGIQDLNESGLSGWEINLKYTNGTLYTTRTTGADGTYTFAGIPLGNYTLSETLVSGWTQTIPAGNLYSIEINATNLHVIGMDFGNHGFVNCCECPARASFAYKKFGKTVSFTDKSTGNAGQWEWAFGDGQTSQLRNPVITYNKSGIYTVTEHVKGMRCDGSTYWVSYKRALRV